jgi:hypothetical protein
MGCVRKVLSSAELKDYPASRLEMELNEGGARDIVHLQTSLWRIELTNEEFRQFAESVVAAGQKLREVKGTTP